MITFLLLSVVQPSVDANAWIIGSKTVPQVDYAQSVGYYNGSFWILGGWNFGYQVTEYGLQSNTVNDLGNYLPSSWNARNQVYTQKDEMLYFVSGGSSLHQYNLKTNQLNSAWKYFPSGIAWTGSCLTTSDDFLFSIGGTEYTGSAFVQHNEINILDFSTLLWLTTTAAMMFARDDAACTVNNGILWVFGGGQSGGQETASNEKMDMENMLTGPFTNTTPLTTPIRYLAAVAHQNMVYVAGGSAFLGSWIYYDMVHEFDTITEQMTVSNDKLLYGVCSTGTIMVDGVIYAFGGRVAYDAFTDAWMTWKIPSTNPIALPSSNPSRNPSQNPSLSPSHNPSTNPSRNSSTNPSVNPSQHPSTNPSHNPSQNPSTNPSTFPSATSSKHPSHALIVATVPTIIGQTIGNGLDRDVNVTVKETDGNARDETEAPKENSFNQSIIIALVVIALLCLCAISAIMYRLKYEHARTNQTMVQKELEPGTKVGSTNISNDAVDTDERMDSEEVKHDNEEKTTTEDDDTNQDSKAITMLLNSVKKLPLALFVTKGNIETTGGNDEVLKEIEGERRVEMDYICEGPNANGNEDELPSFTTTGGTRSTKETTLGGTEAMTSPETTTSGTDSTHHTKGQGTSGEC
eukprot:161639_1